MLLQLITRIATYGARACRRTAARNNRRIILKLESLEDRWCPATDIWIGPNGGNWTNPADWSTGTVPAYSDDVVFNGAYSNGDCIFNGGAGSQVANSITLMNGYQGTLHLQQSYPLHVGSGGIELDGGDIEQDSGQDIFTPGDFNDAGGNLNINSPFLANINVGGGSATKSFETGDNLVVNAAGTGNYVVNMPNGAIKFTKNAGINIQQGSLNWTDGNFTDAAGSNGVITINNGANLLKTPGTIATGSTDLPIDNNGGMFQIQSGTVTINGKDANGYSYDQTAGTCDLWANTTLNVASGFYMNGGNFWTEGTNAAINQGDVTFNSGIIALNHNSQGGSFTGNLQCSNNVFIQGTAEFDTKVDGTNLLADNITATGSITIGGNSTVKAISVNDPGGKVPLNKTWTILKAGVNLNGNFKNFSLNFNDGTGGVYKANPGNPYTLTS